MKYGGDFYAGRDDYRKSECLREIAAAVGHEYWYWSDGQQALEGEFSMAVFQIKINGESHAVDVLPDTPLLWVLRDNLHLTGTKFGCGMAQCGACTIFLDGQIGRASCRERV